MTFTKEGKVNQNMSKTYRIAAGGIIFKGDTVLLVIYRDSSNEGTYLVGPGGRLEDNENSVQAIIRETKEETGVTVEPERVIAIEDLTCSRFKMIKVWMVCKIVDGVVHKTEGAEKESIIEAAWFTKDQLYSEVVFPFLLMQHDWEQFRTETWQVECLPSRKASF
ncbi:MAG: NUDIX hydrolase [Anaerolineales bacterium]